MHKSSPTKPPSGSNVTRKQLLQWFRDLQEKDEFATIYSFLQDNYPEKLREYTIAHIMSIPNEVLIPKLLDLIYRHQRRANKKMLESMSKEEIARLVLFIDSLDRYPSSQIIDDLTGDDEIYLSLYDDIQEEAENLESLMELAGRLWKEYLKEKARTEKR